MSAVCTHPSVVVTQFTVLQPICDWRRKLETGSLLTTGAFTPPTQRNSTSLSANCSDSSRLVETVANYLRIQYTPHNGVGVGGVYWALVDILSSSQFIPSLLLLCKFGQITRFSKSGVRTPQIPRGSNSAAAVVAGRPRGDRKRIS